MAWGYWSATAVDRGRSPRRNTQQQCTSAVPINEVPQAEPPAPTCYSPCRSRCSSPCNSPCSADSPCPESPPPTPQPHQTNIEYSRRPSVDRLDSPQVNNNQHIPRQKTS